MAVQLFLFCKGEISRQAPTNQRLLQPKSQKKNNAKQYTVNRSLAPQTTEYSAIFLPGHWVRILAAYCGD
jgi:hypothetical protein